MTPLEFLALVIVSASLGVLAFSDAIAPIWPGGLKRVLACLLDAYLPVVLY